MRLKASIFIAAVIKRVHGTGGFAAILKKGADEAGAIYFLHRAHNGVVTLYAPALQTVYGAETDSRLFEKLALSTDEDMSAYLKKQAQFDPDLWVVELETDADLPFDVVTSEPL